MSTQFIESSEDRTMNEFFSGKERKIPVRPKQSRPLSSKSPRISRIREKRIRAIM